MPQASSPSEPTGDRPGQTVWVADWSDEEDAALRRAWGARPPHVVRTAALGTSVGRRLHRLRSYPAYLSSALRALRSCPPDGVVVAWQPLTGALAGLLRRRGGPGLVVLNPLLTVGQRSLRARLVTAGLARADRVVLYAHASVDGAVAVGLDPSRLRVVPLGVEPRPEVPPPDPSGGVLAAGRDHRDWSVLAAAAARSGVEVGVAGPDAVPPPLVLLRPAGRAAFQELLAGARVVVVPLLDGRRQAGTLAVLDALAAGRPVVATRGPGTEEYVPVGAGRLVAPGDVDALAEALHASSDPEVLAAWAQGARAARERTSLAAFAAGVQAVVDEVITQRHLYPDRKATDGAVQP